uniref:NRF domain-containing protein n=1 Tax=Parastrongyloides trichosuri TaxID=131310 RepID=A0A0N4ZVG1_PARTI
MKIFYFFILFNILWIKYIFGCILCHKHTPKPPVPLDEFRLPSIEFLLYAKDQIIEYCEDTSSFNLTLTCDNQAKKLFCAVKDLWNYIKKECPGNENELECSKCHIEKAKTYIKSSWIITWFDSIGKMPSGISDGNYHWLGDYEQCALLSEVNDFKSRYCMVNFELKADIKQSVEQCEVSTKFDAANVKLGICTPAECSPEEFKSILMTLAPMPIEINCEPPAELSSKAFIFLFISCGWIIFVLTISIFEQSKIDELINIKFLTNAISIKKNFRRCFSTKRPNEKMHALDGIQFISVLLLIIGNVFNIMAPYMENVAFLYTFNKRISAQPIINYLYHVDGLLVLSALSTALRLHVHVNSIKNTCQLILDRAIRVFPMYAFILFFTTFIFARLGNGPMWSHSVMADRCEKEFWKELLFINNFFGYQETCLDGSYLIANAAQLFLCLMILLYLNKNFPKVTLYTALTLVVGSITYTFFVTIKDKTPPALIPTHPFLGSIATEDYINKLLVQPYSHVASYFIGFLFALFVVNESFPKTIYVLSYIGVLIVGIFVIYTPYPFIVSNANSWNIIYSLYATFASPLWSIMLLVLIYLLDNQTNFIGVFLSWRIFHPLSKLSYVIFMVSEPVALYFFSSLHRPFHATTMAYVCVTMGIIGVSVVVAALVDVFVSRPIRNLFKFSDRTKYLTESGSQINHGKNYDFGVEMSIYRKSRTPSYLQKKKNINLFGVGKKEGAKHEKGCPDYESDVDDISIIEHEK